MFRFVLVLLLAGAFWFGYQQLRSAGSGAGNPATAAPEALDSDLEIDHGVVLSPPPSAVTPSSRETKHEPRKVHGEKGFILRFSRVSKEDPPDKYVTTEVVWVHDSFGYLINLIAKEADHEKYLAKFERLISGFEYLGE